MKNIITAFVVKSNVIAAAMVLTGCLCAWGWLAAQSDGTQATGIIPSFKEGVIVSSSPPPQPISPLLVIKEPSQEDFEHCAKRAVDLFESISSDPDKTLIALQEFYDTTEEPQSGYQVMIAPLSQIKKEITYGCPELIGKKSLGENVIVLHYNYCTDKWPVYYRIVFERAFDQNGEPLKWQPKGCFFFSDVERFIATW